MVAEDGEDWKTVPTSSVGDATADAAPPVVAAPAPATSKMIEKKNEYIRT